MPATIDPLSIRSLFIELLASGKRLGSATGFAVEHRGSYFLITNWHVLSGCHADTGAAFSESGAVPDEIRIFHHGTTLGTWLTRTEFLSTDQGTQRWIEHPNGRAVDVAAVPLDSIDNDIQIHAFDLSLADTDIVPEIAMPVSIIGFPLGLTGSGKLPIWKTGHIASEPQIDYNDQPAFLIDATTRSGMSGSPVLLRTSGDYKTKSGIGVIASSGICTLFLGVYAGRLHEESEIGKVWRPHVITELLGGA